MTLRDFSTACALLVASLSAVAQAPSRPATAPAAAPAPASTGVTGKWNATVNAAQGPINLVLDLKPEGEKLTGTITVTGAEIPPMAITDGSIKGNDFAFKSSFSAGPDAGGMPPIVIDYKAKLNGDDLAIVSSVSMGPGTEPMVNEFTAKRAK